MKRAWHLPVGSLAPWLIAAALFALPGLGLAAPVAAPDCPPTAQPPSPEQVQQGMRAATDHGFLWRITRDGRSSWLYGTIHAARPAWMYPGPGVVAALRSSDEVALELDVLDPDISRRLQAALRVPPGTPPLPAALSRRLAAQAKAACLGDALKNLSPAMQAITLSVMSGRRDGIDPAWGVDGFLAGLARGLSLPVRSLETPEAQLALFTDGSAADTEALVGDTLDELESGEAQRVLLRLARAWSDKRLDELSSYEQWCNCLNTPSERALQVRLLDDRNGGLAAGIAARHQAGRRVFAAVGALHMVGPQGLPALLAAQGFQVERVH
jgi:hypothetical protein